MKTKLSFFFLIIFLNVHSQDTLKIKQIDFTVSGINSSNLPIKRDTMVQNHPELGLKITVYLSMIVDSNRLKKYVNFVNAIRVEDGVEKQMTTSSTFYYDDNNLIKVEEYLIEGDEKKLIDWYYSEEKPLYYTLKSEEAAGRAELLLKMSKAILKQIIK